MRRNRRFQKRTQLGGIQKFGNHSLKTQSRILTLKCTFFIQFKRLVQWSSVWPCGLQQTTAQHLLLAYLLNK